MKKSRYGEEEIQEIREAIQQGKLGKEIAYDFHTRYGNRFKFSGVIAKVSQIRKEMSGKEAPGTIDQGKSQAPITIQEEAENLLNGEALSLFAQDVIALEKAGFDIIFDIIKASCIGIDELSIPVSTFTVKRKSNQ